MKININKQIFYNYILTSLGLVSIFYYIWFRFLRPRLPRDIPFSLTFISFIILCSICLTYIYIIYKILKRIKTNSYFLSLFYLKINLFFKNLVDLHNFFLIKSNLNNFFIKNFYNIVKKYKLYDNKRNIRFLLIFDFIPKFIILLFFLLDVFILKKLNIFYYFLILSIIPLFFYYCIYNCKISLEILIKDLEKNYYIKILTTKEEEKSYENQRVGGGFLVSLYDLNYESYEDYLDSILNTRYFIEIQASNLMFEYDLYKYTCVETTQARQVYAEKYKEKLLPLRIFEPEFDHISKKLAPYFFENIEKAIYLQAFLEVHTKITKPIMLRKHLVIILSGYLIGWMYILFISIHTLDLMNLISILNTIKNVTNPFCE